MAKSAAIILGNYRDYAVKYLPELLPSLLAQDYPGEMKVFIYDNATSAASFDFIKDTVETHGVRLSNLQIIRNENNDGFAKGNNDAIKLALAQGFEYIVLFNLDMVLDPSCIREMVEAIEFKTPPEPPLDTRGGAVAREVAAVQARIMLWPEKNLINSLGNVTHFLGFGYSDEYRQEIQNTKKSPPVEGCPVGEGWVNGEDKPGQHTPSASSGSAQTRRPPLSRGDNPDICYPSGAAVMFKAKALKQVGLFDEEFWMYNEDQDLGWRLWLAGYTCALAPAAVAYHKYEFSRSASKFYWLDRNRMLAIWKNYHWATLVLIAPSFIIMEIGLLLFSIKPGWILEKLKVWGYFLNIKHWPYLFQARRAAQKLRRVRDRDIIRLFSGKIWYQEIDDIKLRLINPVFNAYWQIVKFVVRW